MDTEEDPHHRPLTGDDGNDKDDDDYGEEWVMIRIMVMIVRRYMMMKVLLKRLQASAIYTL